VQQVNSVATMTNGRICLNIVAGHTPEEQRYYGDFLTHDERYDRTDEFLAVCDAFWRREAEVDFDGKYYRIEKGKLNVPFVAPDRTRPEIFLGGNSARAEDLAVKYADCLWRLPEPETLRQKTPELIEKGIEVGLLVSLIVRPTRREALAATEKLLEEVGGRPRRTHEEFAKRSDSVAFTSTYELAAKNDVWLTDYLWSGAVPYLGAPAMAIVGSPDDVADALFEFRAAGVTQFLFMGWPDMEEMTNFHGEVLPRVRAREAAEQYANYIAQD
jgi:alkanesulfonate monooxygenase